jgi:hypothetical protein
MFRRFSTTLLALVLLVLVAGAAARDCYGTRKNVEFKGDQIKKLWDVTWKECRAACKKNSKCRKWSYAASKFGSGCSLHGYEALRYTKECQCTSYGGFCESD